MLKKMGIGKVCYSITNWVTVTTGCNVETSFQKTVNAGLVVSQQRDLREKKKRKKTSCFSWFNLNSCRNQPEQASPHRQAPTPCMEERFCHKPSGLENIYSTQSSENAETQIFISTFIRRNWSKEGFPYLWSNWKSKPKAKYCYLLFSISPQELKSQQKTIYTLHYDLYFSKDQIFYF